MSAKIAKLGASGGGFAAHFVARGLNALEKLAAASADRYLVGDTITMADVLLIPQLYVSRRLGVPLDEHLTLLRVEIELSEHPAFVASHPRRQPDAPG